MFGILKEWVLGFWASSPASKLYIASNNVCMLPASYYTKTLYLKKLLKYKKYTDLVIPFSLLVQLHLNNNKLD